MSETVSDSPGYSALLASQLGTAMTRLMLADEIVPGSEPSYQLCKDIYVQHPLGLKMVDAPINLAQSQERNIVVEDSSDSEVVEAFKREWRRIGADMLIHTTVRLSRIYGIASVVIGAEGVDPNVPLSPDQYAAETLYFNCLDPLNTAGSLVMNQDPNSPDFQKTTVVTTQGETYHRSRCCVVMNEEPIYLSYTGSAFGFSGRSVYQRALYPLKSFIESMRTDDMIVRKLGVLIAKMRQPSSMISNTMAKIVGMKRALLRQARTDNVLSIDIEEGIETLNMQNIDGAGTYARTNILKNIATAADMPAVMLENETMVSGFGEGAEDAKQIARYIDRFRITMDPIYDFFDCIVQYRAWNKGFYTELQKKHPDTYGKINYAQALARWQNGFQATWPNVLNEPESERVKTDDVKLRALLGVYEMLSQSLDPENQGELMRWVLDNIGDTPMLFRYAPNIDLEAMLEFMEEQKAQQDQQTEMGLQQQQMAMQQPQQGPPGGAKPGGAKPGGAAKPGAKPPPGGKQGIGQKNIMPFRMKTSVGS